MTADRGLRVLRLRMLIEHPATGDGERAAAQRMLDRILAQSHSALRPDRSYGERYARPGRHADLDGIAEMIRADLTFASGFAAAATGSTHPALSDSIRDAPAGITFTVETPNRAGIVVTINGVPPHWGWIESDDGTMVSPALQSLADNIAELMRSYNHNGIDRRFFGSVKAGGVTLAI